MTDYVYVQGTVKYFRPHAPDKFGKYKHQMYPNEESLAKIKKLQEGGIKNILKKDEDGYNMAFSRATSMLVKGKVVGLAPPLILMADGSTSEGILVGDGSLVTTKLEVYPYNVPGASNKGLAARWLSSRIDHLVPFQKEQFTPDEEKASRGLEEQPEQPF